MKLGNGDTSREVLVIAEIGNNHEGSFARAQELIGRAIEAGAHVVKFQTMVPEHFVRRSDAARFARLKSFQFSYAQFEELSKLAQSNGVPFLSTPFDLESARFLNSIVPAFKIASGDSTFYPLLEAVAQFRKPILLSTGLSTLREIAFAKSLIERVWATTSSDAPDLTLLHCVASYPVPPDQANLGAIRTLENAFGGTVGYSDHTLGIEAAVVAVALGARVIEKHFTLDKHQSDFRDHQLSADPKEFAELVRRVRETTAMLGSGEKIPQACEAGNLPSLRRSIVANGDLAEGTTLRLEHLTWTRPGGDVAPGSESLVLGRQLKRDVGAGDPITIDILA